MRQNYNLAAIVDSHDAAVELHRVGGGGGGGGGVCDPPRLVEVPRGRGVRRDLGLCPDLRPCQACLPPRPLCFISGPRVVVSSQKTC